MLDDKIISPTPQQQSRLALTLLHPIKKTPQTSNALLTRPIILPNPNPLQSQTSRLPTPPPNKNPLTLVFTTQIDSIELEVL